MSSEIREKIKLFDYVENFYEIYIYIYIYKNIYCN